ncbi:four helix bundle protein [Acidiluteibacter ferrifornacis]|uniref:Four helix bundle protein n=1 Tax=Acidiluteibacter ferrifornacis TaxID=2692424 RepID=A0A6N9NE84_9FLAO|nr:four helix bundle protein [Acidiluteibacter ferrifornacis]NBG64928.1 four helix bundle protein [Acidiluteibacter ferrifornacis]
MQKENIIVTKTISFALAIISYAELLEEKKKYIIARQLLKSGTSIGANMHEAQNSESKADFIHKVKLAAKEVEETKYWLTLCKKSESYPFEESLEIQINEIGLIIYKILSSSKKASKIL